MLVIAIHHCCAGFYMVPGGRAQPQGKATYCEWHKGGAHVSGGACGYTFCVTSSGGSAVLVDHGAEPILAHQFAARRGPVLGRQAGQSLLYLWHYTSSSRVHDAQHAAVRPPPATLRYRLEPVPVSCRP